MYRVRKTWEDKDSQIGAYEVLDNAIQRAKASGCQVYDDNGNQVYPEATGTTMAIKTYPKTDKTELTANFRVSEFSCHGSGCCSTVLIDEQLAAYLQKIRDHFGKPVTINSGYRCAKHNKAVGGATGSYHTKGMAADIAVKDVAPAEVAKYAETLGILGIGLYETSSDGYFVHVDTRTSKSFWYGKKQAYRSTFGGTPPYSLKDFVKEVQAATGAAVDGIAGGETLSKTVTLSASKNVRHAAVKPVQKRLNALGYNAGDADGIAGPKFTAAVKAFQSASSCVTDGEITAKAKTWRKLLGM